ncbi:MAG: hypothetical protein ACI4OA_07305 [Selenomonadaceae bacterium]
MIFMIRITIETNDKTGIGYQLHLKDDRQHREWIARDDKNGWPGGKPFLDLDSTVECAKQIIIADKHFSKHNKDISRNLRVSNDALEANKNRDIGARRMLADMKKGRFEKFAPAPENFGNAIRANAKVEYGKEEPGKPQKVKISVKPMAMVLTVFGVAHENRITPKYHEVVQNFFRLVASKGFGEGGASAMMEQFYALDKDTAGAWVADLIDDADIPVQTLEMIIINAFGGFDDDDDA